MSGTWIVEIEDKKYAVEARHGKLRLTSGSGKVLIDVKVVDA